jgi:hypothetical protein
VPENDDGMKIVCSILADVIDGMVIVVTSRSDMQGPRITNPPIIPI